MQILVFFGIEGQKIWANLGYEAVSLPSRHIVKNYFASAQQRRKAILHIQKCTSKFPVALH